MLWIPELLERLDRFQKENPGVRATLCEVSENVPNVEDSQGIDTDVFIHTFIICMACVPTTLILLFAIQHVSKKILLGKSTTVKVIFSVTSFFHPCMHKLVLDLSLTKPKS